MKKSIFILLLMSIGLYSTLISQSLQVYKKIPSATCSTSNCIDFSFDNDLRIIETSTGSGEYRIEHDIIEAVNPYIFDGNVLSVLDDDITDNMDIDRKYLMSFYHLHKALSFSEGIFGAGNFTKIQFNPSFNDQGNIPQIQIAMLGDNTEFMIDYFLGASYNPIAEDAFAIATGLFRTYHVKLIGGDASLLPQTEGIDYAIANYFAYDYMQNSGDGLDMGTLIYEHAGIGSSGPFR